MGVMSWFDTFTYCKIVIDIALDNTSIMLHNYFVVRIKDIFLIKKKREV